MEQEDKTPIVGVELSLYHVATVKLNNEDHLSYTFTDMFEECGCALDAPDLSAKLNAFTQEHAVPVMKQVTDSDGRAVFSNLPLGLYFVKQTGVASGYEQCTSFLVTVPNESTEGYVYDVNASPKTEVARLTSITIKKVWNTDASTPTTESVTVQLLKGDIVVETALLNAQNQWQVTYMDMPESDAYSIMEVNVPNGFTATYSQNGYVFTVTNSASLIQTGQIVWPIPVLAMTGLIFITIGALALRRARNSDV